MGAVPSTRQELNGICPYFTMFPLEFPLGILQRHARPNDFVLDPFCGRGTTNFAARLVGLSSLGIDSSPVAAAIAASKLVVARPDDIVREAETILESTITPNLPTGEFWQWAFHPSVLERLCKLRAALLDNCQSANRIALRGIVLGALHGPRQKTFPSYFSNQCPRTYAPKPAYSVKFWQARDLRPELIDVIPVIRRRAARYFTTLSETTASVRMADSRNEQAMELEDPSKRFSWTITSPPYYGMRTYIPDQWLRNWFVGGPEVVDYGNRGQLVHTAPEVFAQNLRLVWTNAAAVSADNARMVIRFGGISDRRADPLQIIKASLVGSGWKITTIRDAGSATEGKRQADSFLRERTKPVVEYDVWTVRH